MELRESLSQNIAYMPCSAHVTLVCDGLKAGDNASWEGLFSGSFSSITLAVGCWDGFVRKVWGYGAECPKICDGNF